MGPLNRDHKAFSPELANALGPTPELDFSGYASGVIVLKSGSAITGMTFYGAAYKPTSSNASPAINSGAGTSPTVQTAQSQGLGFQALYDNSVPNPVAVTYSGLTGGQTIGIPDACFGCGTLKIVISGTSIEQVDISLKG